MLCQCSRFPATARSRSPAARGNPLRAAARRHGRGGGGGGEEVGDVLPWIITPFSQPYFFYTQVLNKIILFEEEIKKNQE